MPDFGLVAIATTIKGHHTQYAEFPRLTSQHDPIGLQQLTQDRNLRVGSTLENSG